MLSLINFSQTGGSTKRSSPRKSSKKYVWIANYPSGKAMYKYFKTLEERKKYIDSFNKKYYKKKSAKKASVRSRHSKTSPARERYRANRPSPSVGASSQKIGTIMKGNDGNKWVVVKRSNGVRRWVKSKK